MTTKARVAKYRERLRTQDCRRLEVWVGNNLIESLRTIARRENRYTWAIVKDALVAHVGRHADRTEGKSIQQGRV